ncbi:MAG: hypothetical protein EB168_10230 [Euryarchaeota archaeon]|nr:hypothetical protein [Euryarchaeota archaeon]
MSTDPLDLFNAIVSEKETARRDLEEGPDYPGKTAPKNRGAVVDSVTHEWLNSLRHQEYAIKGVTHKFYTVGALASALNRKPVTIRSWEAKGWIPPASFRTPAPRSEQIPGKAVRGRRLYSEAQIVFIVEAAMQFQIDDHNHNDWDGFRKHIAEHYPKH